MNIEHLARHVKVHHLHRLEQPLSHLRHEYHMYGVPLPSQASMHASHNIQMLCYHWKRRATALCKHMTTTDQASVPWSPFGPWSLVRTLDPDHPRYKTLNTGHKTLSVTLWYTLNMIT